MNFLPGESKYLSKQSVCVPGWLIITLALMISIVASRAPALAVLAMPWTAVTRVGSPNVNPANAQLLSDGRVLFSGGDSTPAWTQWWTLTPDTNGSYANGTWQQVGSSSFGRLFNPGFILSSGKYWVCGAEYLLPPGGQDGAWSACEEFDPVANTWSLAPNLPNAANLWDSPAALLDDGRVLALSPTGNNTFVYTPGGAVPWVATASYSSAVLNNEGGSLLLPDGSVMVGAFQFARYQPGLGQYAMTAPTSNIPGGIAVGEFLLSATNAEIGPFVMLHNGSVLILGGNGRNGLYNPGSGPGNGDSWSLTDNTPLGPNPTTKPYNHADTPACVEPNGKVLTMVTDDQTGVGGTQGVFYEFDPKASAGSRWTFVPNPPVATKVAGNPERTRILALPKGKAGATGQLLVTGADTDGTFWLYTPDTTAPDNSWRPAITSTPVLVFGNFSLLGSQLNGLTTGGDFGDDGKAATNFPIVSLVNSAGSVFHCPTFGFDHVAPRKAPNANGSCWFRTPPGGLADGLYTVQVSASGLGVDPANSPVQLVLPAVDMGPAIEAALHLVLS